MSSKMFFKGANVVLPNEDTPVERDVLVEEGQIQRVKPDMSVPEGSEVIDCSGKIILPGLFDMHAHLRQPGREDLETIRSGSMAAVNGGITGLLAMPNTDPPVDTGSMVEFLHNLSDQEGCVPVYTAGCISRQRQGERLAEIGDMAEKGVLMITDDGSPVDDPLLLRRAMEYTRSFPMIVGSHCEISSLSGDGVVNGGKASYRLGLPGRPAVSEEICMERDLRLAELTGARFHVLHVTTAEGVNIVRRFKERGVDVTCEVTPHHLIFSDEDLREHDTRLKMNPPLRRPGDNRGLLQGLKDGVVDCIATDHAPHARFEKDRGFDRAPFGILGLETALLSLYTELIEPGRLTWNQLVQSFSTNPRNILNLEPVTIEQGHRAELVVFNPDQTTFIDESFLCSKSSNTPFLNQELRGRVEKVLFGSRFLLDRSRETPLVPPERSEPPAPEPRSSDGSTETTPGTSVFS